MKHKNKLSKISNYTTSVARMKEIKEEIKQAKKKQDHNLVDELDYENEYHEQNIYTEKLKVKNADVFYKIKEECKKYGTDEITENLAFALIVQQPKNTSQLENICNVYHMAMIGELLDTGYCKNYGKAYGVALGKVESAIRVAFENKENEEKFTKYIIEKF